MNIKEHIRKIRPWGVLVASGALLCACTLFSFAGRIWWFFELFSHFRAQYVLLLVVVTIPLLCGRKFRSSLVMGSCAAINCAFIVPYYFGAEDAIQGNGPTLRIISINVNTANKRHDLVTQYVLEKQPDILLLLEVNERWMTALGDFNGLYPHRIVRSREDNFGIAILSKRPWRTGDVVHLGDADVPSVHVEFDSQGQQLTILGTHPVPPRSSEYARMRDGQIDAVARFMGARTGPRVIVGDLNMTPWSHKFDDIVETSFLRDSARGFGMQGTWPTRSLPGFRIPIDHCLVSSDIRIAYREIGGDVGSDHFPLLIDIALSHHE